MHVHANGLDVHCLISGRADAPPLLCLHSLATDGEIWARQLVALESRFRVIRPDFRGHGGTTATEPPYSIELLKQDTLALLDELSIDTVRVMGVSLGAIVAIGMSLDAPERVARAVVADCRSDAPEPYVAMWDGAIATARAEGLAPVIATSIERWFSPPFRASSPELVDQVRARALRTPLDGFIGCASAVQKLAYRPRLGAITMPVLFVVGSEDPAAPPAVMREMARAVPDASLVELPGVGHLTPFEAGDEFTDAVLAFLEEAP